MCPLHGGWFGVTVLEKRFSHFCFSIFHSTIHFSEPCSTTAQRDTTNMFSADMWFLHVCKVTEREGKGGVGERGAVSFYNYPWRDMTCPDIDYCLDIVQVMESHLSLGQKVLNLLLQPPAQKQLKMFVLSNMAFCLRKNNYTQVFNCLFSH